MLRLPRLPKLKLRLPGRNKAAAKARPSPAQGKGAADKRIGDKRAGWATRLLGRLPSRGGAARRERENQGKGASQGKGATWSWSSRLLILSWLATVLGVGGTAFWLARNAADTQARMAAAVPHVVAALPPPAAPAATTPAATTPAATAQAPGQAATPSGPNLSKSEDASLDAILNRAGLGGSAAANPPASASTPPPAAAPTAAPAPAPPPTTQPVIASLPPAPDPALVQSTPEGPLPQIDAQGRQPWQVYARPFNPLDPHPRVALVVSNLGLDPQTTQDAISKLPGGITLAFLPYADHLADWLAKARAAGHEVLVELPMEPLAYPRLDPGPRALLTQAPLAANLARLDWVLSRGTGYVGLASFMGSRFEADSAAFKPVLDEIHRRGLLFLDRLTDPSHKVAQLAASIGLPYAQSDAVIDRVGALWPIENALAALEDQAKKQGRAVGVASPFPVTIEALQAWAGRLASHGLVLAPISAVVTAPPSAATLPGAAAAPPAVPGPTAATGKAP